MGFLERALALVLLLLAVPVLAPLALAVLLVDGRPVLYRGQRLGLRKRPFLMYKVRTLRRGAERCTATRLLRASDQLEIPFGRLIRDARLDELPQLWNIVRGEMRFLGPRPERPQVYQAHCRSIPGYSRRFDVLPGLIGPSQLFTPHSTPKRIRAWLDNAWAGGRRGAFALAGLILYTMMAVAIKLVTRGHELMVDGVPGFRALTCLRSRRRRFRRVRFRTARALVCPGEGQDRETLAILVNMNEEALLLRGASHLRQGMTVRVRLEIELAKRSGGHPVRRADCVGTVVRECGDSVVLAYSPATQRSHYVLHQYFLREALALPPFRFPRGRRQASIVESIRDTRATRHRSPALGVLQDRGFLERGGARTRSSAPDGVACRNLTLPAGRRSNVPDARQDARQLV